ncbi:hypothetical protein [Salipaludibacillus aurantiacus]|uniref:Uncharacterized protein n=1 Tax=Salipaludibacillus aurantiacus TaxID=1601833 RepID=A0A1H9VPX4_9BACI|nr:hypothetical protein [Salipaludibacillus aurantiacus]SES23796.1 hypothetical protein SAMN05518684_11212 [Salipaludibacillus aurantiacus]
MAIYSRLFGLLGILCYITSIIYLISQFYPNVWLVHTYSVFGAVLLFFAVLAITGLTRVVVLTLLAAGSYVFFTSETGLQPVLHGFGQNMNLLTLFLLIPLIGTFMSTAGYLSALKEKVKERERQGGRHPYRLSYLLIATIGALLNFGSLAIVKRIADESFSSFQEKKLTLHIMRAFAFCMLWSPYFVNVGLVLVLFDVSWFDIGGYGMILGVIYMAVSVVMLPHISFADDPYVSQESTVSASYTGASLHSLFIFSIVLVGLSFLLDYLLAVNMLTVVSLLAVVLPFIWAAFSKILRAFIQDVYEQAEGSFSRLKNELAVFISAGYFGLALAYTELGEIISSVLFQISFGSVYLFTVFVMLIAILLAQIGIHPIIIVIGIGSSLTPSTFGVSPQYIALTLLLAWTMATQLSPFSGQVLMSSKLMNTPAPVIARQNAPFISICFVILSLVLYSFHFTGWL